MTDFSVFLVSLARKVEESRVRDKKEIVRKERRRRGERI